MLGSEDDSEVIKLPILKKLAQSAENTHFIIKRLLQI